LNELPDIELPEIQPGDEVIKEIVPHNEASNERSLARRLALQALYEIDSAGHEIGEVMNTQLSSHDQPVTKQTINYMRRLVVGVMEHRDSLDTILRQYASEFPLSQIAIIDRNILRMAALEFAVMGSTPVGVAIDEAVELAKLFGAEGAPRFINGVLGALADDEPTLTKIAGEFTAEQSNSHESEPE
jgi:transcription antitermination protein NusB